MDVLEIYSRYLSKFWPCILKTEIKFHIIFNKCFLLFIHYSILRNCCINDVEISEELSVLITIIGSKT